MLKLKKIECTELKSLILINNHKYYINYDGTTLTSINQNRIYYIKKIKYKNNKIDSIILKYKAKHL